MQLGSFKNKSKWHRKHTPSPVNQPNPHWRDPLECVILTQACVKRHLVQSRFLQIKKAVLSIQRWFRHIRSSLDLDLNLINLNSSSSISSECSINYPVSFNVALSSCTILRKIGEASYSEVYLVDCISHSCALKVIPVHNDRLSDIRIELISTKALGNLPGFIKYYDSFLVKDSYDKSLLSEWDKFHKSKPKDVAINQRPASTPSTYLLLFLEFGGKDLEHYPRLNSKIPNFNQIKSILLQTITTISNAESILQFEHRDLHWGNLLIINNDSTTRQYNETRIKTHGVHVSIIDFNLSRITIDNKTIKSDFNDAELFIQDGDYQFEVYRMMRELVKNDHGYDWDGFYPKTNVYWIHYLVDKMVCEKCKKSDVEFKELYEFRGRVLKVCNVGELLSDEYFKDLICS